MKKLSEEIKEPTSESVVVEPPREATKEDNRLIFAKLNDVYLDEKTGYSAGWSDEKVSSDLGVPRAWVTKVREDYFGTAANEEVISILNEGRALIKEGYAIRDEMAIMYSKMKDVLFSEGWPVKIPDLEKRLNEIEKKYK